MSNENCYARQGYIRTQDSLGIYAIHNLESSMRLIEVVEYHILLYLDGLKTFKSGMTSVNPFNTSAAI